MKKLVELNFLSGSLEDGFPVIIEISQICRDGKVSIDKISGGYLPKNLQIKSLLEEWQKAFRNRIGVRQSRVATRQIKRKRVSVYSYRNLTDQLTSAINQWLNSEDPRWREICDSIYRNLDKTDEIRIVIQSDNILLQKLPWQAWSIFKQDYPNSEIALSGTTFRFPGNNEVSKDKVEIIVVLGNKDKINTEFDRDALENLRHRGANLEILEQPNKKQLVDILSSDRGWHIFFFAGHSSTSTDGQLGTLEINDRESLTIDELKNSLSRAISNGLQLAIFNSCDGLGLAYQLKELQLPQSIVMREPIPDPVAQDFLKYFLEYFSQGKPFYNSVRRTRNNLEDLWDKTYPGISWLPVIYQNPSVVPPTWEEWIQYKWKLKNTLFGHSDTVQAVAISPDGRTLATGSIDKTIKLWNFEREEEMATIEGHSDGVMDLDFSPDGQVLASCANMAFGDGIIKLWNVKTQKLIKALGRSPWSLRVSSIAFSPDGTTLASGDIFADVKLWYLDKKTKFHTLKKHGWDVWSLVFSSDGNTLVSGGMDGAIQVWNWRSKKLLRTLNRPSDLLESLVAWFDSSVGLVCSVAITPDSKTVASGDSDGLIKLWDIDSGRLLRTLTEHTDTVYSLAFNPDGKILASGSGDGTIKIWDFNQSQLLQTLRHLGPVRSVAFRSDGRTLVSGSVDRTIKIWSL